MGVCEVLIPLTNSPSSEVQGNSAAALGNLSSKGMFYLSGYRDSLKLECIDGRSPIDDYSAFNDVWDKPEGGMHKYLYRFLTSPDSTFQHIAVWTIVQLLESGGLLMVLAGLRNFDRCLSDPQLISNIRSSNLLIPNIKNLAASRTNSPTSSVGTPRSHHSHQSYQETDTNDGQGEIQILSRRIIEFMEVDIDGLMSSSVPGSQVQPGSSVASSNREHEELRRSVREAFNSPGSRH